MSRKSGITTTTMKLNPPQPTTSSSSQDSSSTEWNNYCPQDLGANGSYRLGISAVIPRPVAVITTRNIKDDDGIINCAPFSYTGLLSHDPPIVAHGICLKSNGEKKDTLVNIEQTNEWVFNVLSDSYVKEANACSEELLPNISEVDKALLNTLPSLSIVTPRLAEAMVAMECVLESTKEVFNDEGTHTTTIVMGKIVRYHIHTSVLKDGNKDRPTVDLHKLRSVGRAGDITYWPVGEGKELKLHRP